MENSQVEIVEIVEVQVEITDFMEVGLCCISMYQIFDLNSSGLHLHKVIRFREFVQQEVSFDELP